MKYIIIAALHHGEDTICDQTCSIVYFGTSMTYTTCSYVPSRNMDSFITMKYIIIAALHHGEDTICYQTWSPVPLPELPCELTTPARPS